MRPIGFASTASLVSFVLLGCHAHVHDDDYVNDPTIHEQEPNDQACCADFIGVIGPHEDLVIRGHVTDAGWDPYDGFAFVSAQPIDVEIVLESDSGADLDVCVYDPLIDDYVACFQTGSQPEWGLFSVLQGQREFHLVVNSFSGTSSYTLNVLARPVSLAPQAAGSDQAGFAASDVASDPTRKPTMSAYTHRGEREVEPALELVEAIEVVEIDGDRVRRTRTVVIAPSSAD